MSATNNGKPFFTDELFAYDPQQERYFIRDPRREYYWPADGSDVEFVAIVDIEKAEGILWGDNYDHNYTLDGSLLRVNRFSNFGDGIFVGRDLDVAYSCANKDTGKDGVPLNFSDLFSTVRLLLYNDDPDFSFLIKKVSFGPLITDGVYDIKTQEWQLGTSYNNLEFELNPTRHIGFGDGSCTSLIQYEGILPQFPAAWDPVSDPDNLNKGTFIALKMNIVKNGEQLFPAEKDKFGWVVYPFSLDLINKTYFVKIYFSGNKIHNGIPDGWIAVDDDFKPLGSPTRSIMGKSTLTKDLNRDIKITEKDDNITRIDIYN